MSGNHGLIVIIHAGTPKGISIKHPFIALINLKLIITGIDIPDTSKDPIMKDIIIRKNITGFAIIIAIAGDIQPAIPSFLAFRCAEKTTLVRLQRI
jgi:hypothetical protein